jgi:hypothetical protein
MGSAIEWVTEKFKWLYDGVKYVAGALSGFLTAAIDKVLEKFKWLSDGASWVGDKFSWLFGGVKDTSKALDGSGLTEAMDNVVKSSSGLGSAIGKVGDKMSSLSGGVKDTSKSLDGSGLTEAMANVNVLITGFTGLLQSVPVIYSVTDTIATAIKIGQEKIKLQMSELKSSFVMLDLMTKIFAPMFGTTEPEHKKKVLAETISTVQVKTDAGGSVSSRNRQLEVQEKQMELISDIADSVKKVGVGGPIEGISQIVSLFAEHLPKLGESPSKLSTRMNNWA